MQCLNEDFLGGYLSQYYSHIPWSSYYSSLSWKMPASINYWIHWNYSNF